MKGPKADTNVLDLIQEAVAAATVGSPYILNSPNVQEAPPHVNRPDLPVPSCYSDERGEIQNLLIGASSSSSRISSSSSGDGKRINILHSKA
jgi:hypothetical protein